MMQYRREVDGLRALAVVPVILFHAGFPAFSGGFVGVDVFFVISGYLITSIILQDLQTGSFSLVHFYERRARRILPALFLVMAVSCVFAYTWMLPDELKNFGQSILATTLFSNNILLALTSNYWSLASEFKPLLHTWSLGVEEQYYILFPFLLMLGWTFFRKHLPAVLGVIAALSFAAAIWGGFAKPELAFYLLPTRAWEILLGALVAFYLISKNGILHPGRRAQLLSALGLCLIVASVLVLGHNRTASGAYLAVPTLGTALILLFATEGTLVGNMLGRSVMVQIGLISYSAYLWHQPLFAFARIYAKDPPGIATYATLSVLALILAYLTWRLIETPCRNKKRVSRGLIFSSALVLSVLSVSFGTYLYKSYGVLSRIYDVKAATNRDLDKVVYNSRVFQFKKDNFLDAEKLKVLVVGNSFGRDFVNMTLENFDTKNVEIVYRDDLSECIFPFKSEVAQALYSAADVIVFASGGATEDCVRGDVTFAQAKGKNLFYSGTKQFGYNLNWIIRLNPKDRPNQWNRLLPETLAQEKAMSQLVPADHYISLLKPITKNGDVPITDGEGRLLSVDRVHLTKFGAIYIGEKALLDSRYGEILKQRAALPETNAGTKSGHSASAERSATTR